MNPLLSLTTVTVEACNNVPEIATAVEHQSIVLPAIAAATGIMGVAYFKKNRKLSKLKLKLKLLKLSLKKLFSFKKSSESWGLGGILLGSMVGLAGFVILLSAMFSGGTVLAYILAILLLLGGGFVFLMSVQDP